MTTIVSIPITLIVIIIVSLDYDNAGNGKDKK